MNIKDYITNNIETVSLNTKIKQVNNIIHKNMVNYVPVLEGNKLIGNISENDIASIDKFEYILKDFEYMLVPFFSLKETNILELINLFSLHESDVIPVINNKNEYQGCYEILDVIRIFQEMPFLVESGTVLVISKAVTDVSFSEISQIIESNGGKIFGILISNLSEDQMEITLKLSHPNVNSSIQSLRRYGYNIISELKKDLYLDQLKDRSDYLNKYLNV